MIRHRLLGFALLLTALLSLPGCTGTPEGLRPVGQVDAQQYLGTWYEIARLEHPFERGLEQITAQYSARPDGGIDVVNRGYNPQKQAWEEAKGRAYFVDPPNSDGTRTGHLRVTFFWPVYSGYNILVLDPQYRYALVSGPDRNYLWILSRTPQLNQPTLDQLVSQAKAWGFATEALIYTPQHSR